MASRLGAYVAVPNDEDTQTLAPNAGDVAADPRDSNTDIGDANQHSPRSSSSHEDSQNRDASIGNPKRLLTFLDGLALVIGLQIGSGIFSAPSQVSQHVPSPSLGVLAWFLGGLLVWTGATSFIELGLTIPKNGGIQEYLRYCYGDFLGFLFAWIWVVVAKPCAMAMVALVFSDHLCRALLPAAWLSLWLSKALALFGLAVIAFINCLGTRTGALLANGFLILKIFAVFSVALLGLGLWTFGTSGTASDVPERRYESDHTAGERSAWKLFGSYVTAVFGVLFCYGGWETVGFVAGDMKDPIRDLPRVINVAMILVIVGFVLMNTALYTAIPIEKMRETSTPVIDFGIALLGKRGGVFYSFIASACALGALHANVFATARLCVAASERAYFPGILANLHVQPGEDETPYYESKLSGPASLFRPLVVKFASATATLRLQDGVPVFAVLLCACLASFYIIIGAFNGLITFYGISEYLFFFLVVLGLYKVRRVPTATSTSTPAFKTWTVNPIIFCCLSGILVLRGIITDLLQGAVLGLFILVGWILFRYKCS